MPCRSNGDGDYEVIADFFIDDWLAAKIKETEEELQKERACVGHLIPGATEAVCMITEDTMLPGEN
jgi:malate dehydrogenase (NADP+)